ncbi:MAG: RagB/SusD family nutrient uptake outer membrane protein [Bacteroidota bacterium]|nr:RagB/SusD family nutrient uptake outer membrane protein [Bacteroidota bacterium]
MKKLNIYLIILITGIISISSSCKKVLDIPPPNETLSQNALESTQDYQNLLNSAYNSVANALGGNALIFNEILSDNLEKPFNNNDFTEVFNHNTLFFNGTISYFYGQPYEAVFRANYLMEHADDKGVLSAADKNRMLAECRFIRALSHFELLKLFAQPYGYTSSNSHLGIVIKKTSSPKPLARNTVKEGFDFIIEELKYAIANLPVSNGNYADKNAAKALLAKVYFCMNGYTEAGKSNYSLAAQYADEVISSGAYTLSDTGNVFASAGASEVIFKIVSTSSSDNRAGAFNGNYRCDGGKNPQLRFTKELYIMAKDTTGGADKRGNYFELFNAGKENEYIGYNKFNMDYFNVAYLHLTDMKLLRAEALAESGGSLTVAIQDVNDIKKRAYGTGSTKILSSSAVASDVITAARYERRLEMAGEGDRVFQMKRMGAKGELINGLPVKIRKAPWNCPGMILQFPIAERTSVFIMNETGGCN